MSVNGMQGSTQVEEEDLTLVMPGRGLGIGAGWEWIAEAWTLFTRAPLMWIISLVILIVIVVVLNLVPFLGWIASQLFQPVLLGGLMVACRKIERDGDFELAELFSGFSRRFVPLVLVGLITMLGWIVIFAIFMGFVGMALITAFMAGDPNTALAAVMASAGSFLLGALVVFALSVLLMAAYWFAPALVIMHDVAPLAAMKASFFACFRNFLPFLLYGLVMLVFMIVALIPIGLGLLVYIPVAIATVYTGYRQIFTDG